MELTPISSSILLLFTSYYYFTGHCQCRWFFLLFSNRVILLLPTFYIRNLRCSCAVAMLLLLTMMLLIRIWCCLLYCIYCHWPVDQVFLLLYVLCFSMPPLLPFALSTLFYLLCSSFFFSAVIVVSCMCYFCRRLVLLYLLPPIIHFVYYYLPYMFFIDNDDIIYSYLLDWSCWHLMQLYLYCCYRQWTPTHSLSHLEISCWHNTSTLSIEVSDPSILIASYNVTAEAMYGVLCLSYYKCT